MLITENRAGIYAFKTAQSRCGKDYQQLAEKSSCGEYADGECAYYKRQAEHGCAADKFLWNYPRVLVIFWFTFAMAIAGVKVCTEEAK